MYFLSKDLYFPPVATASDQGILAVGGDLEIERLILAYKSGIFPWFDNNDPILWWAPTKRMVVYPNQYVISKSNRNLLNQKKFEITFNKCFKAVVLHCQNIKRKGQQGTWISDEIVNKYCQLHEMGIAKSVEVWQNNELVGGLYGIDLGTIFCGESMFSIVSNASKVAFISLINHLKNNNYALLDCQVHNHYLEQLGAFEIERTTFMDVLKTNKPKI
ncbi:MAG: leucyl/phenylalanyl-tRNA--protein transferase [Flavobacterium sp.]|nr:leucyl/phenylalanyl-tRNA--protein transferase [Flavobacterium sp.]